MIKAFPGGWDAMAGALGMSRDALENRIYERKGQGVLEQTARQIQKFSGTTFYAEAVATDAGGVFLKLPADAGNDNEEMWVKAQKLQIELGRYFEGVRTATADGVIDAREQVQLADDEARVHRVMAELHALVLRLHTPQPRREEA
jgi:hypothetical protein